MAYVRKYGAGWRVEVEKLGVRDSATFPTKGEANAWGAKRETEILEGSGKTANKSLHDAFDRYILEVCPKRNGERWEKLRLQRIKNEITDRPLKQTTTETIAEWRDASLKIRKGSSVRREMELVRGVFEVARTEWKWISKNPCDDAKKPAKSPNRTRTITPQEVKKMLVALGYSEGEKIALKKQETALAFLISLETAMRAGEVLKAQVKGRVAHLPKTKNGDARDVPLSKRAVELFGKIPKGFTVSSGTLDKAFRDARDKAKLSGFTFHDSRATALTRLAKILNVLDLARMVGHRDPRSLMIYYRESAEEIADKLG